MINHVMIEGTLTKEPEARTAGQKTVLSFSIAQNSKKKDASGNWVDGDTSFFDVEFWPNDPQFWIKRLQKGTSVVVVGFMKQDRWEKDGQQFSRIKITANDVVSKWIPEISWQNQMKAARTGTAPAPQTPPPAATAQPPEFPSDIPF